MDRNTQSADAHPLSEKQRNTEDSKLATAVAAITDPTFPLPALNNQSSVLQYILSFGTLAILIGGGIIGAWLIGVPLLQTQQPVFALSVTFFAVFGALFVTGTVWIDWFELVWGYWWLSMPIGAAAGLMIVMNQEKSTGIKEST